MSLARRPLWVLGAAGLLVAAIETPLIATANFAPDRELWIVLNWVIGVGFVLVGIYAWMRRPENLVGALMVATGFAWFISVLGHTEPAPFFTVRALFDSLFVGVAIHLFLSFPSGRLESKVDRWLVGAVYAAVTVGYIPHRLLGSRGDGLRRLPRQRPADNPGRVRDRDGRRRAGRGRCHAAPRHIRAPRPKVARLDSPQRRAITPVCAAGAALMLLLATLLVLSSPGRRTE